MKELTDNKLSRLAGFRLFANTYPHEAYEKEPEAFWLYFHRRCPDLNRQDMERILNDTVAEDR